MNKGLTRLVVLLAAVLAGGDALADLTGARATPRQIRVNATSDNIVSVTWRVSTTADHRAGVSSPAGVLIDTSTREVLQTSNTTFDAAGAGPYSFRETLVLDAAAVSAWIERGVKQVLLQRSFGDPVGNAVTGSVVVRLDRSSLQAAREAAPAALSVTSLRLEFGSGNNTAVTGIDESLRATLTVQYTGTGILRGRWQVAEPESPDAALVFRTLALVNTNLQTSQRSTLRSPLLPTRRNGRYVLRFCATNQDAAGLSADALCPNPELVTAATYHVQGQDEESITPVRGLSPDRQSADGTTVFSWRVLPGAHIYQLQVFEIAPAAADLPASRAGSDSVEPKFVTGMLLDAASTETVLSELVRSKLEEGHRYLWRVTAHDEAGRMIGRSKEASFVYTP